jgi:lipoate-protein ligase A
MEEHLRLIAEDEQPKGWNMAADQALLELSLSPTVRIYSWKIDAGGSKPGSIGYSDPWSSVPMGRAFVRRLTGGSWVDHASDFTYSIILPQEWILRKGFVVEESYCFFHEIIATALREWGIQTRMASENDRSNGTGACFKNPVLWDLIDIQRNCKIAGAAQKRTRSGLLHQGSVLGRAWSISEKGKFGRRIAELLCERWNLQLEQSYLTEAEIHLTRNLQASRYDSDSWNKRI